MPPAARLGDLTNHGGAIVGPGIPTVMLGGQPAAVATDMHVCVIPPVTPHPTSTPFVSGSATVMIGGKPALRISDPCGCGAMAAVGLPTVMIGG